jgi:hypothetical protein
MSIYQDSNSSSKVLRKQLIYRDKSRNAFVFNELVNFSGTGRLQKTMHKSDWLSMKYPDELLMRTKEYIPTACQLDMMDDGRDGYKFDGIGRFKHDFEGSHA